MFKPELMSAIQINIITTCLNLIYDTQTRASIESHTTDWI